MSKFKCEECGYEEEVWTTDGEDTMECERCGHNMYEKEEYTQ